MPSLRARFFELFRSGFTELSFWKRWLLRGAVLLLVGGGIAQGYSAFAGDPSAAPGEAGFSSTAWTSGLGCIVGFIIGAALRIAFKMALLIGVVVAAALYGISAIGWIDLPWESFAEVQAGVAAYIGEQTSSLKDVLSSYLPSSALSGLGFASGVTQRPDTDPDD